MTIPTIVITLDGGVIQDVSVTHQVNVIVLDRDTEGAHKADLTVVTKYPAWASTWGILCPSLDGDLWIAEVLTDIKRDQRPA